jgi:hypothetical protein
MAEKSGSKRKGKAGGDQADPAKKPKYNQVYLSCYSAIPGIKPSKLSKSHAFCNYCNIDISISHSGRFDITRHCGKAKHKNFVNAAKSARPITQFLPARTLENNERAVIKAETMMTEVIVNCNMPLSVADVFTKTLKAAFPDSAIAKKYECGRSKTTALVKELARDEKCKTVVHMIDGPFSLATDGSNDQRNKQFPVVVNTSNLTDGVKAKLLSVPVIPAKTGATGR